MATTVALMGLSHINLDKIKMNECLVTKNLLMNVTKINRHSNVTAFVHAILKCCITEIVNAHTYVYYL